MFNYQEGTANNIAHWFSLLEAFLVGCGWLVVSGSGTTDIILNSTGESGLLTKLFIRVEYDGVGVGARSNVMDDALGTHKTTDTNIVCTQDLPFFYAFCGDKDYVHMYTIRYYEKRHKYVGLIERIPTGLDETYGMVSFFNNFTTFSARILRNFAGAWDQAINVRSSVHYDLLGGSTYPDNRFALGFTRIGDNTNIVGTLKNVSTMSERMGCSADEYNSEHSDAVWKKHGHVFMLSEGTTPYIGYEDTSHFLGMSLNSISKTDLYDNLIIPCLVNNGWTQEDNEGVSGFLRDKYFHSAGEDGLSDIHIRIYLQNAGTNILGLVCDITKAHTTNTHVIDSTNGTHYAFSDRDCFAICYGNTYIDWFGKCWNAVLDDSGTPNTDYLVVAWRATNDLITPTYYGYKLKSAVSDQWFPATGDNHYTTEVIFDGNNTLASSLNLYANACLLFPIITRHYNPRTLATFYQRDAFHGALKNLFLIDGTVVLDDTINVGAESYIVKRHAGGRFIAFRRT